jgi:hypothetical protein
MPDIGSDPANDALTLRKRALSRWDNEGGAEPSGPQAASPAMEGETPMPQSGPAGIAFLHVRVIALENLLIALLATASDRQLELAREMAAYITPRPGFTHHALTTQAAAHMVDLVERASRFREGDRPSPGHRIAPAVDRDQTAG